MTNSVELYEVCICINTLQSIISSFKLQLQILAFVLTNVVILNELEGSYTF